MSLQERLDAALREKRELTALRNDQRLRSWLRGGTASNARRGRRPERSQSERPTSLASAVLQQAMQEKAALLQLRAQRTALHTAAAAAAAAAEFRTDVSPSSVQAIAGVPPSPTAFRLQEERQRLHILQQESLEKLADVRELVRQKTELQAAARAPGVRANVPSILSQSQLRPTAPPFAITSAVALEGCAQEPSAQSTSRVVPPAAIDDPNQLTYVGSFRPEEQDASGAVWPFHIESTLTLELSRAADSTITTGMTTAVAGSMLGFLLTRRDRIRRKGRPNLVPGVGEHVTTREWSGDCSLVPHHHVDNVPDGTTIEIDATLRARHRRNYHKAPLTSLPDGGPSEDQTRQRQQQDNEGREEPYDETLKEPLVRGGRIIASGHKFVVWGWGGTETVTLISTGTPR
jgi:hypothetical protein